MRAARAGRRLVLIAALGAVSMPAPLLAQDETRDRTGPDAGPVTLPSFPDRRELAPPIVPAPSADAPAATSEPDRTPMASVTVRQVRVAANGDGGDAIPPPAWNPPSDEASGLRLEHEPGQPLDENWIRAQFARNLGDGGTVSQAVALIQLVNRAFLTAGFFNSGVVVPQQTELDAGILELRLVYGRLAASDAAVPAIAVEWGDGRSSGLDADYVRSRFGSVRRQPLSAYDIERDFRLLAEDPAIRTVSADLRPGTLPGEASLSLIVFPDRRVDFYTGVANDRSPSVGGERLYGGGFARNLLAGGDVLSGEFGITDGLEDVQVAYAMPIFTPRLSLTLRGSYNDAAVVEPVLVPLGISARDRAVQAGFVYRFVEQPLMPTAIADRWSPSRSLAAGLQVLRRWQKSFLFGEPFSFAPGSVDGRTVYTALRLTGDYLLRNVDQVLAVSVTGTLGLGGTQSPIQGIPSPDDHFKALLVQANYARRIDDSGLELRARLTGQIADGLLYSGERFSIGGETSVRGYRENLFLADMALVGSVELALPFSLSPRSARAGDFDWGGFTISAFADAAAFDTLELPSPEDRIASVGLSLAWTPSDAIVARITYAEALDQPDLQTPSDLQDRGFQFRITIYPLDLL